MSSISLTEAQGFSNPDPTGRYHFDNRPVDQFFEILPFESVAGHGRRINVVDATSIDQHASLVSTNAGAVVTTLPSLSTRESPLSHFAARLEVDSLVADQYSSHADLLQAQLQVKVAAVLGLVQRKLVNGNSANAGEFDGLIVLGSNHLIGADAGDPNGGIVAKGEVERVISMLSASGGVQNRFLVMRSDAYYHLYRNNYSNQIFIVRHPKLGPLPAISGVPILLNDYIPNNLVKGSSNDTTMIFAVNLGKGRGLCGLYPVRNAGREVQVRGPFTVEGTDRIYFDLTAQFGLTMYQGPAVAALDGVRSSL